MLLAVLAAASLTGPAPRELPVTPLGQCTISQCGSAAHWDDPPPHALACPGLDGTPVGPITITLDCIGPQCEPITCCQFIDPDEVALQLWPRGTCDTGPPGISAAVQPPHAMSRDASKCKYVVAGVFGRLRSTESTATYSERVVAAYRGGAGWSVILDGNEDCQQVTHCYPVKVNSVDLNQDCFVNTEDIAVLADYLPPNPYDPRGDLNMDGVVNGGDQGVIEAHMGHGCLSFPVEGSLEFFNTNRFTYPPNSPQWIGGSSDVLPPTPAAVCADGATDATLLAWSGPLEVGTLSDVHMRIKEDPTGTSADEFGSLTFDRIEDGKTIWRYAHPTRMTTSGLFGWARIEVFNTAANDYVLVQHAVRIYRPPVAMIHGLWADRTTFGALEQHLLNSDQWTEALLYRHDYSPTNDQSFLTNALVGRSAVASAIARAAAAGISAGRVDIVAHSMGGILSRLFLQNAGYNDDIHRLITLNVPHSGSQLADFVILQPNIAFLLAISGRNPYGGALADLRVLSDATIEYLNGPSLNLNKAPSHVVTTEASSVTGSSTEAIIAKYVAQIGLSYTDIFHDQPSDLIVPVASQQGGLGGGRESFFLGPWHNAAPGDPAVLERVRMLLNADRTSTAIFSQFGFAPPVLTPWPFSPQPATAIAGARAGTSESVAITSPAEGSVVNAGATITVNVTGSAGITAIQVAAGNASLPVFTDLKQTPTASFSYSIPTEAVGEVRIGALGYSGSTPTALDSVNININVAAGLDSIVVSPARAFLSTGGQTSVAVAGYYADGIERTLTDIEGVSFSTVDTTIARFDAPGLVVGVFEGQTFGIASFGGYADTCTIVVSGVINVGLPGLDPGAALPGSYHLSRGVPNPFRSSIALEYSLPQEGDVELAVYDVGGRRVRTLVHRRMAPGTHGVTWDGRHGSGLGADAGIYFMRLSVGGEVRRTQKVVLLK